MNQPLKFRGVSQDYLWANQLQWHHLKASGAFHSNEKPPCGLSGTRVFLHDDPFFCLESKEKSMHIILYKQYILQNCV